MPPPAALQRDEGADHPGGAAALQRTLDAVEDKVQAAAVERAAEAQIVLMLQLQNFDAATPEWQTLQTALIEYGYGVFMAWTKAGVVRRMASQHGGGRGVYGLEKIPEAFRLEHDEAHELVADLVATAVESFRTKTLADRRKTWTPTGGASIKTYFVGRVFMELPAAYLRWKKSNRSLGVSLDHLDERHHVHTENDALDAVEIEELLEGNTRTMFELQQAGMTLLEIAESLSTTTDKTWTEGAVRTAMSRARGRAKRAVNR